jgi:hypothetical protein
MNKKLKIYSLYQIDQYGKVKFIARYGSYHRMLSATMFLSNWFYEVEEKDCAYGGTVLLT